MTWEETIKYIRAKPEFKELVEKAYFEEDLVLNVERFIKSEEFMETLSSIQNIAPHAKRILDIGSGNGISAIAFALSGYHVTVSEPDPSDTIGAGAIRKLRDHYGIKGMDIYEEYAENICFENDELFDLVYVRQAMHHANDLNQFVNNLSTLIKPQGFMFTVRDHVVYNEKDKNWFLEKHPLHKYYGGENAFTFKEYKNAIESAGFSLLNILKHYESVINFFPMTIRERNEIVEIKRMSYKNRLKKKIGFLSKIPYFLSVLATFRGITEASILNERKVPGRMYSFLARKH